MDHFICITTVILCIINLEVTLSENATSTSTSDQTTKASAVVSNETSSTTNSSTTKLTPAEEARIKKAIENEPDNDTEIFDDDDQWTFENKSEPDTRRILYGRRVTRGRRPYMVYMQLTEDSAKVSKYVGWLCGGVIVHAFYVLTSAACVEDADHFFVMHGTNTLVDIRNHKSNECVCRNRRRVVWKCIPKNYKFNFEDSLQWSANDIAIVKVHRRFRIGVVEPGCAHAAQIITYNNISRSLEQRNTRAVIAGWGTTGGFREGVYRRFGDVNTPKNSRCLQEARVCIMDKTQCTRRWAARFRDIINTYMICTRDVVRRLSEICEKKYANCTEIVRNRRLQSPEDADPETWALDTGRHLRNPDSVPARRLSTGGFCENDHGGPLIVTHRRREVVIGVISACKIDPRTHNCHGPFLYTSVFYNRQFMSCSINKDVEQACRRVFRSGVTHEEIHVDWTGIKDDLKWEGRSADAVPDEEDGDKEEVKMRATEDEKADNIEAEKIDDSADEKSAKEKAAADEAEKDDEILTGSRVLRAKANDAAAKQETTVESKS